RQALQEAEFACNLGYHAGLLSLSAFQGAPDKALIEHCHAVARAIPLIGFYLQPAGGGRLLSEAFWRRFVEIPNVIAIKIAPFNRYQTLDVLRAVAESGRAADIALYTGNDDNIIVDLLTEYAIPTARGIVKLRIVGGLLGQWAAHDPQLDDTARRGDGIFGQQIDNDIVVIARVQGNVCRAARLGHRPEHVECLVAVEGRDLDGDHVRDFHEAPPERLRE